MRNKCVIYAISGYKNSGKTSLVEKLVSRLSAEGYRVAVIKHDGHDFEPDVPGTDSYRHRKAGAYASAVFSADRFMVTRTWPDQCKGQIDTKEAAEWLMGLFPDADLILLEGFKDSRYPKYFCSYPDKIPDEEEAYQEIIELLKQSGSSGE